jgi:hypothetical protein
MKQSLHRRRPAVLWTLVALASAFNLLVHFHPNLTGNDDLNGLSGVCLGLFIAAFPAANFLDLLLFETGTPHWRSIKRADLSWMVLNLFALFAGLTVIVVGTGLFFIHWEPG